MTLGWKAALVSLLLLSGCGKKTVQREARLGAGTISYARVNAAVFKPYCLGCHAQNERPHLNTYAEVKDFLPSIRRTVFQIHTMPKRGELPEDEQKLLFAWIEDGAPELPEKVEAPAANGPRQVVHFKDLQKNLFQPRCVICHFPENPQKLSNLEDYETARSFVGALLFLSVAGDKMPPAPVGTPEESPNPNKLSAAEKEVLAFWVIDGMQK